MDIKVGDKVFFELDDMDGVLDLTSGKEYAILSAGNKCPTILDDKGSVRAIYLWGTSSHLDERASWQKAVKLEKSEVFWVVVVGIPSLLILSIASYWW